MRIKSSFLLSVESCVFIVALLRLIGSPWWLQIASLSAFATVRYLFTEPSGTYERLPSISPIARLVNLILIPFKKFQLLKIFQPITLEELKKEAVRQTGYNDFGDSNYEQNFNDTISLSTTNSALGHITTYNFLLNGLIIKLRAIHELKTNPALSSYLSSSNDNDTTNSTTIRRPVFVIGMPRTGTTYLHKLLALDPSCMAPTVYELHDPIPATRGKDEVDDEAYYERDRREKMAKSKTNLDFVMKIIPEFEGIHSMNVENAEECIVAMKQDTPILFATFYSLCSHLNLVRRWNLVSAYQNYKNVLQMLQYQRELMLEMKKKDKSSSSGKTTTEATTSKELQQQQKRWALKCPLHLLALPDLSAVFDDARIVWTHRDMTSAIPSWASFLRISKSLVTNERYIKLDEIGRVSLEYAEEVVKIGDDFFSKSANKAKHPLSHVTYTNLIKDPINTVKALYKDFGYDFTDEYQKILEDFVEADNKKREAQRNAKSSSKRLHSYTLEEYGLTEEMIDKKLGWYRKKYIEK